jgi:hypothetical protein
MISGSKKSSKKDKSKKTKGKTSEMIAERLVDNERVLERSEVLANEGSTHSFEFSQTSEGI